MGAPRLRAFPRCAEIDVVGPTGPSERQTDCSLVFGLHLLYPPPSHLTDPAVRERGLWVLVVIGAYRLATETFHKGVDTQATSCIFHLAQFSGALPERSLILGEPIPRLTRTLPGRART